LARKKVFGSPQIFGLVMPLVCVYCVTHLVIFLCKTCFQFYKTNVLHGTNETPLSSKVLSRHKPFVVIASLDRVPSKSSSGRVAAISAMYH